MRYARISDPSGTVRRGSYEDGTVEAAGRSFDVDDPDVDLLAPCEPTKIVCVGRNYAKHAEEMGNDVPDRPLLFLKGPNAVAPPNSTVPLPAGKERIDHEAELGVVVGAQARNVDASDAWDVVAGITCVNDVSNRDDQNREQNWVRGKAFDSSAPLGPVVADVEHVPDDAAVKLRVNGEEKQHGSRDQFIFDVPALIEEITTYLTLEPGDVVATGTPAGVGPLEDGDRVEVEVEGVGVLEHDVSAE